jgi:hypothetical protein
MSNKQFAEKLNKELDSMGVPTITEERVEAFSKLLKVPKFKAEAFLNGVYMPDEDLLETLAHELEVNPDWLLGKSESKHKKMHTEE